jgi:hypothetical protein
MFEFAAAAMQHLLASANTESIETGSTRIDVNTVPLDFISFSRIATALSNCLVMARDSNTASLIRLMSLKNYMFDHGLERLAGGIDNLKTLSDTRLSVVSTEVFNIYVFKMASKVLWHEDLAGW